MITDITEPPPDNDIAFRVFDDNSQAHFFENRGDIRCSNWREFDIKIKLTRTGAKDHITGVRGPTDYISISTSPRRLWNIVTEWGSGDSRKIAVIDLGFLRRLGIPFGSSTDDLEFRVKYATKHHLLVVGWVPARSVLGFLSTTQFRKLLEESQINISSEAGELIYFVHFSSSGFDLDRTTSFHRI